MSKGHGCELSALSILSENGVNVVVAATGPRIDARQAATLRGEGEGMEETGLGASASDLFATVKELAAKFGSSVREIGDQLAPDEIEIKFRLDLSQSLDAWWLGFAGKATEGVVITLKWKGVGGSDGR